MKKAATGSGAVPPRRRGRPEGSGVATVTRENILRAAVYCFARSGYAQTSNRDIAQAAGITSGSLYHYFDSKSAIFQAALRQCTLALVETYRAASVEAAGLQLRRPAVPGAGARDLAVARLAGNHPFRWQRRRRDTPQPRAGMAARGCRRRFPSLLP
jgi:AcrR family transcriptional regulator